MSSFLAPYTQSVGMTTAAWMRLPIQPLPVKALTPTQELRGELWPTRRPSPAACADPYIHVVRLGGALYVEDGHHRLARARRDRLDVILARLLDLTATTACESSSLSCATTDRS